MARFISPLHRLPTIFGFVAVAVGLTPITHADNWPQWRGPTQAGAASGENYPTSWSNEENVLWQVELPGSGSSTPIVWDDHVVVTCANENANMAICYSRDGEKQWQTAVGSPRPGKHKKATGANPSAVTDGKHVYVYFKSGDLACLDWDGKVVWKQNLQTKFGEDTLWWDLGTSPVLTRTHLVIACMQSGPSYVAAFDKESGKLDWKVDRMLNANSESNQSYSTPMVVDHADGSQTLVILGADHVTAHRAVDGKELWRVGGLNPTGHQYFRSIASPVVADGIVVAPYARGKNLTAIRMGGSGDVTKSHVAWHHEISPDVPTPAVADGKVYMCTDRGNVHCFDLKSGKELWTAQAPRSGGSSYSASPVIADGKLYMTREDGLTAVLTLGADGVTDIAENRLVKEMTVATPVLVDGRIYQRSLTHLTCIGK